jgi:lipopolysaccharide export system protein LptA
MLKARSMKNRQPNHRIGILPLTIWMLLVPCGVFFWTGQGLWAEPAAEVSSEPIHITADRLVTDAKTDSAQFSGNVRAVQGDTEITADRLTVYYQSASGPSPDPNATTIKRIVAQGHVRIAFDNRLAVSEQAVYITAERILVLEGPGSKMISGRNEIVGSKITFFRDDGRVAMEGDGQNRVKAVLHSDQRGLN